MRRAQRGVINVKSIPRHLTPVMSNPYRSTQNFHSGYTTTIRRVYFKLFTPNFYHSYIYIYTWRYRSASARVGAIMRDGDGIYNSERNAEKSAARRINRMMDREICERLFFRSLSHFDSRFSQQRRP